MVALKKILLIILAMHLPVQYLYSQLIYNWYPVSSGTSNILNSTSPNWIAGTNGTILYSSTTGESWININSPVTTELKGIVSGGTTSIAVGVNGTIIKTTNAGSSWQILTSGTSLNLYSIARSGSSNYYSAGDAGIIIATTNGGTNWINLPSVTGSKLNYICSAAGYLWAAGNNGVITASTNGGANWSVQANLISDNLNCIEFSGINTGWAAGDNGRILKTTNGGTSQHINSLEIYGSTVFAAANNGVVLKTSDGGLNWNALIYGLPQVNFRSVSMAVSEECWVTRDNGSVYKRKLEPLADTLNGNNIQSYIAIDGTFNRTPNSPAGGFEWPKNTGKTAVYSSGFNIAAYVNNQLRIAAAFYDGEFTPGYCVNGVFNTDSRFKLYKVSSGDNFISNPDWANWGEMEPYGAPYSDINNSGTYEAQIDIPGIKDAAQTIFLCMTDADPLIHDNTFPFYGSTAPLGAEVHLTAWVYNSPGLTDIQFLKWAVINKSNSAWDSTLFSIITETDLGGANDDYIGCDTLKNMGYCYNADNDDVLYGPNPPAYGMRLLNCDDSNSKLTSFNYLYPCACGSICELYPNNPMESYNFLNGLKKDRTPWVIPNTNPPVITKFTYSGDLQAGTGWKFSDGKINNCGGSLTGQHELPGAVSDMRFIMSTAPGNRRMNPGDTSIVQIAQFIGRGTSNLNSIIQLTRIADVAYELCQNGFVIGINPVSSQIPAEYNLQQNYPNPFNPVTKIKFALPKAGNVMVKIYDAIGREISTLVNGKLNAGVYSVDWDAASYPSGVYFYKLQSGEYSETKKMVLVK